MPFVVLAMFDIVAELVPGNVPKKLSKPLGTPSPSGSAVNAASEPDNPLSAAQLAKSFATSVTFNWSNAMTELAPETIYSSPYVVLAGTSMD